MSVACSDHPSVHSVHSGRSTGSIHSTRSLRSLGPCRAAAHAIFSLGLTVFVVMVTVMFTVMFMPTSDAALMQITQIDNEVTPLGDTLNPDITGDGLGDVAISSVSFLDGGSFEFAHATVDGIEFQGNSGLVYGGALWTIEDTGTGALANGSDPTVAGSTYFLPVTFNDAGYSAGDIDAFLEIRVEGNVSLIDHTGVFLRRVIFDPDARGFPTGYSEFVSYPEAERIPEPASAGLLLMTLPLMRRRRRRLAR